MTNYIGISQGYHDAGIAIIDCTGNINFAGHAERYSKKKNDAYLNDSIIKDAISCMTANYIINYYERTWLTNTRRFYAGQSLQTTDNLKKLLSNHKFSTKMKEWGHHLSHAAAAFQTSPYDESAVVIVDAVGEWDTATIWHAKYLNGQAQYKKLWSQRYPNSIGLFYTAMTQRAGLRPLEDEYVLMGMAAYGTEKLIGRMRDDFISNGRFKDNLHVGVQDWQPLEDNEDIAYAAQKISEDLLFAIHKKARELTGLSTVCYGGGVALNCSFNAKLHTIWDKAWIMPNPGDCGSSLGAAALAYGKKVRWKNAFLGTDISKKLDINAVVSELQNTGMVGVANGRAEFGPRALGNRSLLADPIRPNIKDQVNDIKQRQRYRPFAPAILAEHAKDWFDVKPGFNYDYMQYAVNATKAQQYPAICHVDQTARVQTVPPGDTNIRKILEAWYNKTGIPFLLNTSLNIRGQPIVNDKDDANDFTNRYGIRVL